jgi:hypothetical protein
MLSANGMKIRHVSGLKNIGKAYRPTNENESFFLGRIKKGLEDESFFNYATV